MSKSKLTALIVEDHEDLLGLLTKAVENLGVKVIALADGRMALATALQRTPDIAILDIHLPGLTGIQLAEQMRRRKLSTRTVFITAHAREDFWHEALSAGAMGYLQKPFEWSEFERTVVNVLRGRYSLGSEAQEWLMRNWQALKMLQHSVDQLSDQELWLIKCVADGQSDKQIAWQLHFPVKTVQKQMERLRKKLGVHNRIELLTYAIERRLILLPSN